MEEFYITSSECVANFLAQVDETFYTASIEQANDETFGCFTVIDRSGSFAIPRPPAEVVNEEVTA